MKSLLLWLLFLMPFYGCSDLSTRKERLATTGMGDLAFLLREHEQTSSKLEDSASCELSQKELLDELKAIELLIVQSGGTIPERNYAHFARSCRSER